MSTEERRVQLVAEVDTTRTRSGFQEIGQQAGQMAQQVTRAGEQAERAVAGVGNGAGTSSQRVDSASRSIVASIQRTTAAMEAGGRQTAAYYEVMARQRGIDPNTLRPYLDQLRSVEQAQIRTAASGVASAGQIANAMRMVPAQLTDVATQLAGGQSPFLVLLQQGGQLRDSFGSIPATIRGVGASILSMVSPVAIGAAAVGALAYAYSEGSKEADAYTRSIIMSANAAGASTSQMSAYAAAISKTVGTQAEASQAVAALVSTGQVGAENLKQFGTVAVEVQKYIGRSVEDTVKDFQELGKSPVQASLKLSESYSYLTAATYEQIKALQDQGKTEEAAEVAQKAYASAFADRAAKMKDNLGLIERAWMGAKDSAASAWDVFLGVGRKKTPAQELAEVQQQISLARQPAGTGGGDRGEAEEMRRAAAASKLTQLLKRESELQKQIDKEAADAQDAASKEKLRQAQLSWSQIMEGTLSQAKRQQKEIDAVIQKGADAGASQDEVNKAIAKIKEKYFALNNATLTQLENNRNLQKERMAGELADAESQYKRQLISQDAYYAKKRDIQLREIDLEIPILKEQARIADGKEEKSAREKANGELAVLMQKRANIISSASNSIREADFERKKSIDDVVAGWDRTITAQREAVAQELLRFGQSDQARKVYLEQMKLEIEMRKKIEERRGKSNAYTDEEIADYRRRTNARKAEVAEVLNEQAALAAASQLLRDNEKFSAQYIADTDLRAQRITAIDAKQWQYLIDHTAEGSEARKKILEQFDVWMANRQMQPVLDRWKGVIDNLDNNFQEGFRDMLTGGQNIWSSFAKSIGNTLKTSLADALYQTFIKKYVVQIVASLAGAISGPAVAATLSGDPVVPGSVGGGNSAITAAQAASNMYNMFKSGGTFEQSITNGVQAGFDKLGLSMGGGVPGEAAMWAGRIGGTVGGYMIGSSLNSAISGKYETGSGVMTAEKIGTAVASAMFGPIGGAVAGAIGGFINRAFGMGPTEIKASGLRGMLSAGSVTGESYQNLHQDGGWFRSDKNWTDTKALTSDLVKQFTQGITAIESASSGFASSLGIQADWIQAYSKSFDLTMTGDATKDQETIVKLFGDIGDELARKLVPNLDELSKSGESASAALERLAGDFKGTDQVAQLLGSSANALFGSTGLDSAKAREQLIDLAGGISTLSSQAQFFNQNFLTDAERIKPVAEALDKALGSLGLSTIPKTRDEFKALVNSLITTGAVATESGAKQLDSLLALGEAFAQVHPDEAAEKAQKAAAILQERQGLQDQLDELMMSSTQLLAKQRDALEESNRSLFDQVQASKAAKDAEAARTEALQRIADERKGLQDQLDELTMSSTQLLGKQRAALDESNRALFDQIQAVKSQASAIQAVKDSAATLLGGVSDAFSALQKVTAREKTAIQSSVDTHTAAFNKLQSLSQALHSTLDSLKSPDQKAFERASAQAQIRAALAVTKAGGPLPDSDSLKQALSAVTQDASSQFSSYADYMRDLLQTQNDVAQLAGLTDDSLSVEQKSLDALNEQLKRLDDIVTNGQAQIDALNGQSVATLSLAQAMAALQSSIGSAKSNPVVAGASPLAQMYQDLLGRAPDKAGMDYWQGILAGGTSLDKIRSFFMDSDEYKKLHPFAVGTNFVPQTMPALVHQGERIIPAADNRVLMSVLSRASDPSSNVEVLAAAVDRLTAKVAEQQAALDRIANNTGDHKDMFENATDGGNAMRAEIVNAAVPTKVVA